MNRSLRQGPPRFGVWLLKQLCSYDFLSTALWDLEELHEHNRHTKGQFRADLIYFKDALGVIRHLYFEGKSQYSTNTTAMLKNNLVLSLRNLKRNKSYSSINLAGLASGLLIFLMIITYVRYELSFDNYHQRGSDIYQIYKSVNGLDVEYWDNGTPGPLANAMEQELPEVEATARMIHWRNLLFTANGNTFIEPDFYPVDPSIFQIFSIQPVDGEISQFIKEPNALAISESVAQKYFGRSNAVGELLTMSDEYTFKVSGVFKDMPQNSQIRFDVVGNFEGLIKEFGQGLTNWNNNPYFTYVLTRPGVDPLALEAKLPALREKFANDPIDEDGQLYTYYLQTLQDTHFSSKIQGALGETVNRSRLYIFMAIALAVLLMSCINYVNLATARSISKLKEVGTRKIVGAQKRHLFLQFLVEAGMLVGLAFIVAFVLFNLLLPAFANFVDRPLTFELTSVQNWLYLAAFWLVLTLAAGSYPAVMASSYNPLSMLNGRITGGRSGAWLRNGLVVFQLVLSAGLAIGAMTVGQQLKFIDEIDTGYTREKVLLLSTRDNNIDDNLSSYMEGLSNISGVAAVASSWSLPTNVTSNIEANWPGIEENERIPMYMMGVTHDFFNLYKISMKEGRAFDPEIRSDRRGIILNETAVKAFGWEQPIGREMITDRGRKGRVIGVVKDFHIKSLREEIQPLQIILNSNYARLAVRVSGDLDQVIGEIEKVYESFSPQYPFDLRFFEDEFEKAYASDRNMASLTGIFTILAVIIACLGIYGLASYQVHNQIKALGIRKVLGASSWRIARMLFSKFTLLLLLAMFVATPLALLVMQGWLDGFAYHVNIGAGVFILTFLLFLAIVFASAGYHTFRAAVANPVDSLNYE